MPNIFHLQVMTIQEKKPAANYWTFSICIINEVKRRFDDVLGAKKVSINFNDFFVFGYLYAKVKVK